MGKIVAVRSATQLDRGRNGVTLAIKRKMNVILLNGVVGIQYVPIVISLEALALFVMRRGPIDSCAIIIRRKYAPRDLQFLFMKID